MLRLQAPLSERYTAATDDELAEMIGHAKEALGSRVFILGHHYQRDDVMRWADARGDSYGLSRLAAGQDEAEFIVFCGVHFMAESADVLTGDHQQVVLPDLNAGCSMADMADIDQVEEAWDDLARVIDVDGLIPVTYMNSAAALKAFVGKHGGAVCTSSNARAVLTWALERGERVLFFPDQHLGRNTGYQLGFGADDMRVWNPRLALGGLTDREVKESTLLLWKGHCSVHQRFRPEHVEAFRAEHPEGIVMIHPECAHEVVELGDVIGSTDAIIRAVERGTARLGDRCGHRDPSGQASQRRVTRQDRRLSRSARLPVLDHVAHRSPAPGLDSRRLGRRAGAQSHPGRRRDGRMGQGGTRAHARHHLRRSRAAALGGWPTDDRPPVTSEVITSA